MEFELQATATGFGFFFISFRSKATFGRVALSLSLSLSLSVFLAHTNLMQLALTMGRFVCFYFLYCLLLPLFVFCFLIIIFITFFCSSTRAARKEIPTAIVWAGQRVDSARRLTRPPHNFTVKRGSGQIYFY